MGIKFNAGKFVQGVGNAVYDYSKDQQKRQDTLDEDARRYQQQKELIDYREQVGEGTRQKIRGEETQDIIEYAGGSTDTADPAWAGGTSPSATTPTPEAGGQPATDPKQKVEQMILQVAEKSSNKNASAASIMYANGMISSAQLRKVLTDEKIDKKYIDMINPEGDIIDKGFGTEEVGLEPPKKPTKWTKGSAQRYSDEMKEYKKAVEESRRDKRNFGQQKQLQDEGHAFQRGENEKTRSETRKTREDSKNKVHSEFLDDNNDIFILTEGGEYKPATKAQGVKPVGKLRPKSSREKPVDELRKVDDFNASLERDIKRGETPENLKRKTENFFKQNPWAKGSYILEDKEYDSKQKDEADFAKDETGKEIINPNKGKPLKTKGAMLVPSYGDTPAPASPAAQGAPAAAPQVPTVPDDVKSKFNETRKQNPNARLMYNPSTQQYVIQ